jgi:hypothetical protein
MKLKMSIQKAFSIATLMVAIASQLSCKKSWLDAKPNLSLVVPSTVADYQALLDNNTGNSLFNFNQPSLSDVGAGDFSLRFTSWQALPNGQERNAYLWNSDIFGSETSFDWDNGYNRILNENIVLEGIAKIPIDQTSRAAWNNVKGTGLFYRAYDFWSIAQEFAKAYDPNTAASDLGIPLRTTSDINVKPVRSTVQQTYDQIIRDLLTAQPLLPDVSLYPTRASKASVYGLMARVYLSEGNYGKAKVYADSCLNINNNLLDYNTLSTTSTRPIKRFNQETIYFHTLNFFSAFSNSSPNLIVDSALYQSYASRDLRKKIFFKIASGLVTRKASYSGGSIPFGGLATDEMYLIRAESNARQNNVPAAMNDLNQLLVKRWVTGTFVPYNASTPDETLLLILTERRKELVFRGLRWTDLKRLNKNPLTAVMLSRDFNGQHYTLAPNSNLYVFPIPKDEIVSSGLTQNPR